MAKLEGGIFSRPRGKTGGVVFGAARTRNGKVVTSRLLVPPSNPNTQAQQTQRSKFKEALEIVRKIGKSIYGSDFNRSVSQLPGFQSMMSLIMNNMDDNFVLSVPPEVNLGTLDGLAQLTDGGGSAKELFITYGGFIDGIGSAGDELTAICIEANAAGSPGDRDVVVSRNDYTRGDSEAVIDVDKAGTDYLVIGYYTGVAPNEGLLSSTTSAMITSG